ncbi:SIS domain-containing protein [Burkholderia mallei]|uniref:DnaA initiator-associating protein DiaA n=3 Tax=Burkholderia mallei TaxID=13373 RepID=A2S704_BURM9|nr:SIS domain-containing protein [Burkholderia mallei]AAU47960.1 phosphoheptose isomerase [Burkholderia mallei ATCC 23344]ABM50342.1 phosphoheptose isomerase [Burkholderia mallei SAVP1]ABN01451.1 DnaA initiator-associating protein DiaA [Burkholderia mallei NCTC 10229]ABO04929.1 DnaA initiator-associating protein DiaA [Burkholderia mallei NCTC 10247]AIO53012.1 SIS domain protein [Burkholderia mallei]
MSVERIQQHIRDSAALVHEALEALSLPIAAAVDAMFMALANGNKIVACGDGPLAAAAERLAAALIGGFERERPGLPGLALDTDASRSGTGADGDQIFAQQVRTLGQTGDVLLVLDPLGESPRVLAAVEEAREREMIVIALTGNGGGRLGASLADTDIQICVPSERAVRIQEVHLLTIHCLCDGIDAMLLGED